jgi:hypothetical protein
LNEMMEKYQENNVNRDIFYEDQKREKVKAAQEEALKKKKENEEKLAEKLDSIDDYDIEKIDEDPVEESVEDSDIKETLKDVVNDVVKEEPVKEEPVKEEPVKEEPVKEEPVRDSNDILPEEQPAPVSSDNNVSEDIRDKLEGDDPWMQKVQRESEEDNDKTQ